MLCLSMGELFMENLGDYYHDDRMQKMFNLVEQPKNLDDIDISESFIKNLVLKIISTYGNIKVTQLHDITGLHVDILGPISIISSVIASCFIPRRAIARMVPSLGSSHPE